MSMLTVAERMCSHSHCWMQLVGCGFAFLGGFCMGAAYGIWQERTHRRRR